MKVPTAPVVGVSTLSVLPPTVVLTVAPPIGVVPLRTTPEIFAAPYALPLHPHWEKFVEAWTKSNYGTYFWNSVIVVVTAVVLITVLGAMVAHALARLNAWDQ